MFRERATPRTSIGLLALLLLCSACGGGGSDSAPSPLPPEVAAIADSFSEEWIALYDPERAWNGYTLGFYQRRVPILIDMGGRVVHAWPEVEARSRVRLLPDGSILTIALGGAKVQEFDWDGQLTWEYATDGRLPHHDLIRLENGNTLLVVLDGKKRTDDLLEVDRDGAVVWEWDAKEYLTPWLGRARKGAENRTHINSVQELPPNPWFDAGDERFRPGNLLISARNLDALFIIDRQTSEIVWSLDEGLEQQHEALMNAAGFERPGFIQLFNNRPFSSRRSQLLEVDPLDGTVAWDFTVEGFFSATKGAQQALPNGNLLVVSSRGWRVFEITREGRLVWQWTPPWEPQRLRRYAYDYTPQLAALKPAPAPPVRPEPGYRYVDRELFEFVRGNDTVDLNIGGVARAVLRGRNRCRSLILPAEPRLELGFGLGPDRLRGAGLTGFEARFSVLIKNAEAPDTVLFEEVVADGVWRERKVPMGDLAFEHARLCVAVAPLDERPLPERDVTFWDRIEIVSGGQGPEAVVVEEELTEEQLEERREHLRSLGYVD
jgi:hypothetical protein